MSLDAMVETILVGKPQLIRPWETAKNWVFSCLDPQCGHPEQVMGMAVEMDALGYVTMLLAWCLTCIPKLAHGLIPS